MFDYLRYYFSPALQVMAAVGIYIVLIAGLASRRFLV